MIHLLYFVISNISRVQYKQKKALNLSQRTNPVRACQLSAKKALDKKKSLETPNDTSEGEVKPLPATKQSKKKFACEICGKCFPRKGKLASHSKIHVRMLACDLMTHKPSATTNGNCKATSSLITAIPTKARKFSCDKCGKCFRLKNSLTMHTKSHTEKKFECDKCDRKFIYAQSYLTHMRVHKGDTQFACDNCDLKFKAKPQLVAHQRIHANIRSFDCTKCTLKFAKEESLLAHMRSHPMVQHAYGCVKCDRKFKYEKGLTKHLKSAHVSGRKLTNNLF